jgi:hypothetical protein
VGRDTCRHSKTRYSAPHPLPLPPSLPPSLPAGHAGGRVPPLPEPG